MADAFDRFQGTDLEKGDAFDRFPIEEESFLKSAARTALQVPQGIAEVTPLGLAASFFQLLALGETELDVEEWQRLRELGEKQGIPWDDEAYENARQEVLGTIPTVSNIARHVEEKTGIPLEPKNRLQKGLRFASSASKIIPKPSAAVPKGYAFRGTNTGLPRPVLGTGVEAAREGLLELGVPEPIADIASFGVIKPTTLDAGRIGIGPSKKESGLTTRQYERLEKPTDVSPKKITKINETVEKEFRDLANKIIEDSPIKETHKALAEDITFKQDVIEGFKKVQEIADAIPTAFESNALVSEIEKGLSLKNKKGITLSEFEKEHQELLKNYIEEISKNETLDAGKLVTQYRKNNQDLGEAYEPGKSFAYNRAKREALLDYNIAIAKVIEEKFPDTALSLPFKETNKRWADIKNSEAITQYLDDLFEGKIQFKRARDFFDKEGMTVPFTKALGQEGFARFETLLNDLLSTEKGMKLLKAAEKKGFLDLAKTMGSYVIHPNLAKAKFGFDVLKGGYNTIFEMLLDKPQLAITWDRGINALKRGEFKVAEKELGKVKAAEEAFNASEKARVDALKKFNENKKQAEVIPKKTEEEIADMDYVYNPKLGRQELVPKKKVQVENKKTSTKTKKKTKIEILDEDLSKSYDKLMKLDEEIRLENRSGKPIDVKIRSEKIKRINAQQKRVDDLRNEIDREFRLEAEKKSLKYQKSKQLEAPKKQSDKLPELPDTRGKGYIFHGSPKEITDPTLSHYSSLNYYGQGFYTTDALDIASGYASRKGKSTDPTIYKVSEKRPVKLFDMETPIPPEVKQKLENLEYHEAIGTNLLKDPKQTLRELYDDMRESALSADSIQEEFDTILNIFEKLGYDGFRHVGGKLTGKRAHEVKIYFRPEDTIKLEKF